MYYFVFILDLMFTQDNNKMIVSSKNINYSKILQNIYSLNNIQFKQMGSNCLQSTPYSKYEQFFNQIKIADLKDHWQNLKIFKMKKIFDEQSIDHSEYNNYSILTFQGFAKIFPELENYPIKSVQRFYEMFDFQNDGYLDWNAFLSAITVCYFGSQRTLALIMFIMFDTSLQMRLNHSELKFLLQTNQAYLMNKDKQNQYEADEVCDLLIQQSIEGIQINKWLKQSKKYLNFSKFKKIFNIFTQQKLQKQLVKQFYDWNEIYSEQQQRFIGYLVDLKWFENWRLYIFYNYNINIEIYNRKISSIKSVKTCKKSIKKHANNQISLPDLEVSKVNNHQSLQNKKEKGKNVGNYIQTVNIDCVNNHLGQRPRSITNNKLQGQYQEVLRLELTENMDYVIVSQKVWTYLKEIYRGYPQFRRTGFDAIQLYPKLIKVYFSLFKEQIDYSTEIIREVSSYLRVDELLTRSCEISLEQLTKKVVYYKTMQMKKWVQLQNLQFLFTELSHEIIIFIVCISQNQKQSFQKSHLKNPKSLTDINLGDQIMFKHINDKQKPAIFMGKSVEGKYILHFVGQSYSNDICLMESELLKQCRFSCRLSNIADQKKCQIDLVGLPNGFRLSYISSILMQLLNIKVLKDWFLIATQNKQQSFINCLLQLFNLLKKKAHVDVHDIKDLIKIYLDKFSQFEVMMCYEILDDICQIISQDFTDSSQPNLMKKFSLEVEKHTICRHCKATNIDKQATYTLKIPFTEEKQRIYEVVWVSNDLKCNDITLHKIFIKNLKITIGDFMHEIQEQIGIKNKAYMLVEVAGNDVVRNYHGVAKQTTLQSLKIRQNDKLYAFELLTDLSFFIYNHFNNKQSIDEDDIKKDQLIDCRNSEKGWIIGKVLEIQYLPYIHNCLVRVLHKFNTNEAWQMSYDVFQNNIARYPLKSYKTAEHYHVRVHQRIFNEASNNMQLINFPLIFALPSWMRLKQFSFLVYLQIRKLIAKEYQFESENIEQKPHKKGQKYVKNDNYNDYKKSNKFPYVLRLSDYEGRCVICYKFLKSTVLKGQNDNYCQGCEISQKQPVSWQFKPADLIVCIDWKGFDRFISQPIKDCKNKAVATSQAIKYQTTIEQCIQFMKQQRLMTEQQLCCNVLSEKEIRHKILTTPDNLIIQLQRIIQQQDGFKRILKTQVKFNPKMKMNSMTYNLMGVTSIQGESFNLKFKTYIYKAEDQWYEYDGRLVRTVNSKYMEKVCALVLFYSKTGK